MHTIKNKANIDNFFQLRILIPFDTKCCQDYLLPNLKIKSEFINRIKILKTNVQLRSKDVESLLDFFWINAKSNTLFKTILSLFQLSI